MIDVESQTNTVDAERGSLRDYCVVLNSIGSGGASLVAALKKISNQPETRLAALLFQAPSVLFQNLTLDVAKNANDALIRAGLESKVSRMSEPFEPGDADHEVALEIKDFSRMASVLANVMEVLGVDVVKAKQILFASPTVLVARISRNTASALRRRFEPLGVELAVSVPNDALFDAFLGECSAIERSRIGQILAGLSIPWSASAADDAQPVIASGLTHAQAEKLWELLRRGNYPVTLLNRDFQRYEITLEKAEASPELTEFLVTTAGMPARIVPRVLKRLPIVTHSHVSFDDMCERLSTIAALGGRAAASLLAFRRFSLVIEKVGSVDESIRLLRGLGDQTPEQAASALSPSRTVSVPHGMSKNQACWLQHELQQVGTTSRLELR